MPRMNNDGTTTVTVDTSSTASETVGTMNELPSEELLRRWDSVRELLYHTTASYEPPSLTPEQTCTVDLDARSEPPAQPEPPPVPAARPYKPKLLPLRHYQPTTVTELTPFNFNCGVELTWLHPETEAVFGKRGNNANVKDYRHLVRGYAALYAHECRKHKLEECLWDADPNTDDHCVEMPTKIMEDWEEAEAIYNKLRAVADKLGLVPLLDNVSSGGGHIHINVTEDIHQLAIFRDLCNRPYVAWCFLDPVDNETAVCPGLYVGQRYTEKEIKDAREGNGVVEKRPDPPTSLVLNATFQPNPRELMKSEYYYEKHVKFKYALPGSKEWGVIRSSGHIELRFYAAANDWREQEEHIAFAQAYCAWCINRAEQGDFTVPTVLHKKDLKAFTLARCKREFKKLIKDIGLPWSRYKHYIEEYLPVRFEKKEWLV